VESARQAATGDCGEVHKGSGAGVASGGQPTDGRAAIRHLEGRWKPLSSRPGDCRRRSHVARGTFGGTECRRAAMFDVEGSATSPKSKFQRFIWIGLVIVTLVLVILSFM